jgi:hypothetical protein
MQKFYQARGSLLAISIRTAPLAPAAFVTL